MAGRSVPLSGVHITEVSLVQKAVMDRGSTVHLHVHVHVVAVYASILQSCA